MQQETIRLTTAQFAKLHNVNKRTLHYYDDIGLFSPCHKGENGYRYYDYSQSIDFEYIRMLKELNLSIAEIKAFIHSFDEQKFLEIVSVKQREIDAEIRKLKAVKSVLSQKKEHLLLCQQISDIHIEIVYLKKEYLLPIFIDGLLQSGRAQVKVLETQENWFGVTYQEDKEAVVRAFQRLIAEGVYSRNLYE